MADRGDASRVSIYEEHSESRFSVEQAKPDRGRARFPRLRLTRRATMLVALVVSILLVVTGAVFFVAGPLDPQARTETLVALPQPLAPAVYSRVATDSSGWVWVAQSAPGLAKHADDPALLTLINPDVRFANPVQARLCVGCPGMQSPVGMTVPALARVDDIAPDTRNLHSIYIAGWTVGTPSLPIVLHVSWHAGASACTATRLCGSADVVLATTTNVSTPYQHPLKTVLGDFLSVGARPVITLAGAHSGVLYAFLSDRGHNSLDENTANVIGGAQALLKYDPTPQQWAVIYTGPAGTINAQKLSPTSTVTAIAVDHGEHFLYLADADHHAVYRLDLTSPALKVNNPYKLAQPYSMMAAITRIAGAPLTTATIGADAAQAVAGWSGDGGPALQARLGVLRGLAIDANGDLFVSDASNGRVRLITPQGRIWTVAGSGARSLEGDGGAPAASGLLGLLGIASGTGGRLYVTQGAMNHDGMGVPLRTLLWGWGTPAQVEATSRSAGHETLGEARAGLTTQSGLGTSAAVVAACSSGQAADCLAPFLVGIGGTSAGQFDLGLPAPRQDGQTQQLGADQATMVATLPGAPVILTLLANPPALVFTSCCGAPAATQSLALPVDAHPTGFAVIQPVTDSQVGKLNGSAYILIATQAGQNGPQLLVYRATAQTCGPSTSGSCTSFPGTPTLVGSVALPGATSTGQVVAALSDDASHAFALVVQPADGQISAIDLSALLVTGAVPTVTAQLALPMAGTIVERHDGQAAYVLNAAVPAAVSITKVDTATWLATGVPTTLGSQTFALATTGTASAAMVLSADDTRLIVALPDSAGKTALVSATTNGAIQVRSTLTTDAQVIALALAADDQRLVTLATPAGVGAAGQLRSWLTHDPAAPLRWLDAPLDLGATATAPNAAGVVLLPDS